MPSFTASAASRSCAGRRIRGSWSMRLTTSAIQRWRLPMNVRWRAWCARSKPRARCGLKLIIGSEFRCHNDLHLVLLAPSQRAYAQICRTHHQRRESKRTRALIDLSRRPFRKGPERMPGAVDRASQRTTPREARWLREFFPERCWIAVEMQRRPDDVEHLAAMQSTGRSRLSIAAGRQRRRPHACRKNGAPCRTR